MIEKILYDYLNSPGKLPVPAFMERPAEPPESYVVVEKTGESEDNLVRTAMVAVQSVAPSLYKAAELNERVIAAMKEAAELNDICSVYLSDAYNFTNHMQNVTKEYRYQAIFEATYY